MNFINQHMLSRDKGYRGLIQFKLQSYFRASRDHNYDQAVPGKL